MLITYGCVTFFFLFYFSMLLLLSVLLSSLQLLETSWDARLCSGFGTTYGNIMLKIIEIKLGFWDNVRKYNDRRHWVWWGLLVFYVFIMNIIIVSPPFFFVAVVFVVVSEHKALPVFGTFLLVFRGIKVIKFS